MELRYLIKRTKRLGVGSSDRGRAGAKAYPQIHAEKVLQYRASLFEPWTDIPIVQGEIQDEFKEETKVP